MLTLRIVKPPRYSNNSIHYRIRGQKKIYNTTLMYKLPLNKRKCCMINSKKISVKIKVQESGDIIKNC